MRDPDLSHIVHLPYSAGTKTAHGKDPKPLTNAPAWAARAPDLSPGPGLGSSPAAHKHELPPILLDSVCSPLPSPFTFLPPRLTTLTQHATLQTNRLTPRTLQDDKLDQTTLRFVLPHSPGEGGVAFVPGSVEVREDGRRATATTYLVLDELRTRWRIFQSGRIVGNGRGEAEVVG